MDEAGPGEPISPAIALSGYAKCLCKGQAKGLPRRRAPKSAHPRLGLGTWDLRRQVASPAGLVVAHNRRYLLLLSVRGRSMYTRTALARRLLQVRPAPLAVFLKRFLRMSRVAVETPAGRFSVDPVSNFGFDLMSSGEYEADMQATLRAWLRPGSTFIDLGANEGYFSVIASRLVTETGRVLTVEPQARQARIIEENFRANGVRNAVIVRVAVSDYAGSGKIHLMPDTIPGSSGLERSTSYPLPTENVTVTTLAGLMRQHEIERADLIKIDIEGFEYEAVFGSADLFRQQRFKAIALELHPSILERRGKSMSEIADFLASAGYRFDPTGNNSVWVADASGA